MKTLKNFVKTHKYEIVLVSAGAVLGSKLATRKYEKREDELLDHVNQTLAEAFRAVEGNFTLANGKYTTPRFKVK